MTLRKNRPGHPKCPQCQMGMIVANDYGRDAERKTYECVRFGYVGKPAKLERADAAE